MIEVSDCKVVMKKNLFVGGGNVACLNSVFFCVNSRKPPVRRALFLRTSAII